MAIFKVMIVTGIVGLAVFVGMALTVGLATEGFASTLNIPWVVICSLLLVSGILLEKLKK